MSKTCPVCNSRADVRNELCVNHKPTWEIKEVFAFGRFLGFGLYSEKYKNGEFPIHISATREDCENFFWDKHNQIKIAQVMKTYAETGI